MRKKKSVTREMQQTHRLSDLSVNEMYVLLILKELSNILFETDESGEFIWQN